MCVAQFRASVRRNIRKCLETCEKNERHLLAADWNENEKKEDGITVFK